MTQAQQKEALAQLKMQNEDLLVKERAMLNAINVNKQHDIDLARVPMINRKPSISDKLHTVNRVRPGTAKNVKR